MLIPQTGIKSVAPALEAQSLNPWTDGKVPSTFFLMKKTLVTDTLFTSQRGVGPGTQGSLWHLITCRQQHPTTLPSVSLASPHPNHHPPPRSCCQSPLVLQFVHRLSPSVTDCQVEAGSVDGFPNGGSRRPSWQAARPWPLPLWDEDEYSYFICLSWTQKPWILTNAGVRWVYAPRFFVSSQQKVGVTDIKAPLAGHSSRRTDRVIALRSRTDRVIALK